MKTNPNYVKEAITGEPFTARDKAIREGLKRTAQIGEFLSDEIPFNYYNMVSSLFPDDMEKENFIWQSTMECKTRFYHWIKSGPGLATLWKFEENLLKNENDVKKYYCKKAFFIDYLNRLRQIYRRLEYDETIKIFDKRDFLALYLFFSQIERFIFNDIGQCEPMKLDDLKHLILEWFYTNMNGTTEISSFEDINKLVILEIVPYKYYANNGSIIPNMAGDRNHYKLEFLEDLDCIKLHDNFSSMEESEDFDNLLNDFTTNNWVSDFNIMDSDFPF
jgi:hypothetical protein